jgi:hypothetical protein
MNHSLSAKIFLGVFLIVNLFLSSYFIDAWLTPNAASRALPVLTLYEEKTLIIDKYHNFTGDKAFVNNHYYSDKAPFSTFLVYPFYAMYKFFSSVPDSVDNINKYPIYVWEPVGIQDGRTFLFPKANVPLLLGSFLSGSVPFAILVTVIFFSVWKVPSAVSPVLLTMLPVYGTFLFALSGVYYGHLLSGLFLLLAYILLKSDRQYFLAGLLIGLAFITEYTTAIAGPVWLLLIFYKTRSIKKCIWFCVGALPFVVFVLYYNTITTGEPFDFLYNHAALTAFKEMHENLGFRLPKMEALWGLLFSTYRGLFFYAPILLLMIFYFAKKAFEQKLKVIINNYLFLFCIVYLLVNASYYMWWGGWSFGPRHLTPVIMILLYEGTLYLSKIKFPKFVFFILCTAGIFLAWSAKATRIYMMPDDPTRFSNPLKSLIIPDFAQGKFNANSLPTLLFDIRPQTSVYLWLILFGITACLIDQWYKNLLRKNIIQVITPKSQQTIRKKPFLRKVTQHEQKGKR